MGWQYVSFTPLHRHDTLYGTDNEETNISRRDI